MLTAMKDSGCKTLNIANIDSRVDERMLSSILSHAGHVVNLRIVPDPSFTHGGTSTGIVEYTDHASADTAMTTLNGQQIYDSAITLSWAISSVQSSRRDREDTSNHIHLWIGDISPEVDDSTLARCFSAFGSMSDARVMWDPNTGKSRGYGFVSFRDKSDAERAIGQMNGFELGSKKLRCNWAHQRTAAAVGTQPSTAVSGAYSSSAAFVHPTRPSMNYHYVVSQSSPQHTTIYVGNVPPNLTIEMLQPVFQPYGFVMDIKVSPDRGFAFIKMDTHENAATAICYVNGVVLNGAKLKCAWGREKASDSISGPTSYSAAPAQQQQYYGYSGYPAGYEQYYQQYYAQYYAQQQQAAAAGYDPNAQTQQQQQQMQAYYQQQAQQQQQHDAGTNQ